MTELRLLRCCDSEDAVVLKKDKTVELDKVYVTMEDLEDLLWGNHDDYPGDIFRGTCLEGQVSDEDKWAVLNILTKVVKVLPQEKKRAPAKK